MTAPTIEKSLPTSGRFVYEAIRDAGLISSTKKHYEGDIPSGFRELSVGEKRLPSDRVQNPFNNAWTPISESPIEWILEEEYPENALWTTIRKVEDAGSDFAATVNYNGTDIEIPDGYRELTQGETIEPTDMVYWSDGSGWTLRNAPPVNGYSVGQRYNDGTSHNQTVRKIGDAPKPITTSDPSELESLRAANIQQATLIDSYREQLTSAQNRLNEYKKLVGNFLENHQALNA